MGGTKLRATLMAALPGDHVVDLYEMSSLSGGQHYDLTVHRK